MENLRRKLKPKHQVLILKCYPRFQANQTEVKPNSSELAYMLYYASTRRSKLEKVAPFLEKKTSQDIHKGRTGDVQVTLQILTALVEKTSAELPLYINHALNILELVLRSHDVGLIEESLPAFGAICAHYDTATLSADQAHRRQWDAIIKTYAGLAEKTPSSKKVGRAASVPENIRYRTLGLKATKSLVMSDSFYADGGNHMKTVMPVILENIYSEKPAYLSQLSRRENSNDEFEKDARSRIGQSMSAQRNSYNGTDPSEVDPSAAAGSTADVDRRANEEVGVLALQSLREIFMADNRGQARLATTSILNFIVSRRPDCGIPGAGKTWSVEIFETICSWTPVQDRFIILVTAMEGLIRSPITENDLKNQLELTLIIGWLLRSNINFIGLSVMDVLIGLIQHILALLQLGGYGSSVAPHRQQKIDDSETSKPSSSSSAAKPLEMETVKSPSEIRIRLLSELQHCIGYLATHVYYSDQIGDMVSALLLRLKPSPASAISTPAAAVQNPGAAAGAIVSSARLQENPNTDGFFSFDTARVLALEAVKDIIVVANSQQVDGPNASGRNRIDVATWEGTQWLLRDSDFRVRTAYVDALLTWLSLEVDQKKMRLIEEHAPSTRRSREVTLSGGGVAQRAVSSASQKSKLQRKARSSFLELLHLATYENALQYAGSSEPDIVLLHLLLTTSAQKLGVNSIRHGLPMISRLEEDVETLPTARAKIAISSLAWGYLWAMSETFKLGTSQQVGSEISSGIQQRIDLGLWLSSVRIPPLAINQINSTPSRNYTFDDENILRQGLQPFRNRQSLVEDVVDEYQRVVLSPPASPQPRPSALAGRTSSLPMITTTMAPTTKDLTLPRSVREQMLSSWSAEACLASIEQDSSRAMSINSRNTNGTQLLTANGSPTGSAANINNGKHRSSSTSAALHANNNQFGGTPAARHFSDRLSPSASARIPLTISSKRSVIRVDELKRALKGDFVPAASSVTQRDSEDGAAESMMSMSYAGSDVDDLFLDKHANNLPHVPSASEGLRKSSVSSAGGRGAHHYAQQPTSAVAAGTGILDFARVNGSTLTLSGGGAESYGRGGKVDLKTLLGEIDAGKSKDRPTSSIGAPPY